MANILAFDDWIANKVGLVAAKCRDWLGLDQWKMSHEVLTGSTLASFGSLVVSGQGFTWAVPFVILCNLFYWYMNHVNIRVYSKMENGWILARRNEIFARMFFFGLLIALAVTPVNSKAGTLSFSLNIFSIVLALLHYYFKCAELPPPPLPKTQWQPARANAS